MANALDDLIAFVAHSYTGAEDPLSFAPALEALGRDTSFLKDYLERELRSKDFQATNAYREKGVLHLAHYHEHFEVRLTEWRPDAKSDMYREALAHTHNFDLLTYGVLGPGYTTDIFEVDPLELHEARMGDKVKVKHRVEQLYQGRLMAYPAFAVAHVQHPPAEWSLSVGLVLFKVANPNGYVQYFVDPVTNTKQPRIPTTSILSRVKLAFSR